MSHNTEQLQVAVEPAADSSTFSHPIQLMARFFRIVLFRREILIVALTVSVLLGALYYLTATRIYQADASLLVLQTGQKDAGASMPGERVAKDLMPTYTSIATSEAVLQEAVNLLPPEHRIDFGSSPRDDWAKILKSNLSVNAMRGTNILSITYVSKDPDSAAAVVDAVLSAYLKFMNDLYRSTASEIADLLDRKLQALANEYEAKVQEKRQIRLQAQELAIKNGEQGVNVVVARAIDLNTAWLKAHTRRLEYQSQLSALEQAIQRGEDVQQYALAMIESVGNEFIKAAMGISSQDAFLISASTQQLLKDKADLQTARQVYGPQHHSVREIEQRIHTTEQFLANRREFQMAATQQMTTEHLAPTLLNIARQELEQAIVHEQNLLRSFNAEKTRALELDVSASRLESVEHTLDHLLALKEALVERLKDIDLDQGNEALHTEVIKRPEAPKGPASPDLIKTLAVAIFLGLSVGLGIIYILDLLDDRFRSPEEMQIQLGVPILAMIRKLAPLDQVGPGGIHVHVEPTGVEAESFRTLRTALAFAAGGATRLVVTSTEPGDGKTTISVNLGAVISQAGKRVLLIDADMRRPGLTPLVNLRGQAGLSAILRDSAPLTDSIRQNLVERYLQNLDVIPSGPRPANPMELLASDRFSDLMAWAETIYDQIIIDSPPVLAVSDSAIIGRLVDGIVLTVRPEKNRRRLVVRAVESFPPLGVNILGLVINSVDADKNQDYYGYGYGYGYSYDYAHDDPIEDPTGKRVPKRPRRATSEAA